MATAQIITFGQLLKRYRLAAGMTQERLAERAGVSVRGISDLERGASHAPFRDTVERLASALGLPTHERAVLAGAAHRHRGPASPPPAPAPLPSSSSSSSLRRETIPPPLVGRAHEFAQIDRFLAGEDGPLLMLAGEPGIGKTRLLRETAARARAAGWCVVEGGCARRVEQEPFAPLLGALARRLSGQPRATQRAELRGCAWLVRLLPELAEHAPVPLPRWILPPDQERRLMLAAVARYLANIAGPAGTLLLLDDLQWAGADTLDLLGVLLRQDTAPSAAGSQALCSPRLLGAYRATEVRLADPMGMLLADLAREGLGTQLDIGPLQPGEATTLVERLLASGAPARGEAGNAEPRAVRRQAGARLVERAGGVPFFLVSGARALAAGATEIPWDVAQSIRQRIALLPAASAELLGLLAVASLPIKHALLRHLALRIGQAPPVTLSALEAAVSARLLAEDTGCGYRFTHDLILDVVSADLGAARRGSLQRQIAEALEVLMPPAPDAHLDAHLAAEPAWHYAHRSTTYTKYGEQA